MPTRRGGSAAGTAAVPTGVVTFLFTDIEASTRRWDQSPVQMQSQLASHDQVVRSTVETHGGYIFGTGGVGFAVAFSEPVAAIDAGVEALQRLELPVRMGAHTGTADERDGNYFGPTLNRAARLMSTAHGGQFVVSDRSAVHRCG